MVEKPYQAGGYTPNLLTPSLCANVVFPSLPAVLFIAAFNSLNSKPRNELILTLAPAMGLSPHSGAYEPESRPLFI